MLMLPQSWQRKGFVVWRAGFLRPQAVTRLNADGLQSQACSADTTPRDVNDLLVRGVLRKLEGEGAALGMSCV